MTAWGLLRLSALARGPFDQDEAEELLRTVGLWDRREHRPGELSGGEQQRLALAAAVIGGPAVLVADEPTAELDSESGRHLLEIMDALAGAGTGFVVATHDPMVMKAADRILSLRHGALEAETTEERSLAVIDASGRVQLPPDALKLFPGRRAVVRVEGGKVQMEPP